MECLFWYGCDFIVGGNVPCLQHRSERYGRLPCVFYSTVVSRAEGQFCSTVVDGVLVYLVCSAAQLLVLW